MRHPTRPHWRVAAVASTIAIATTASLGVAASGGFQIGPFAGGGGSLGDGGNAQQALLSQPHGIAQMKDGSILIADTAGNRIRMVDAQGRITTFAGTGVAGGAGDGGPAASAQLSAPQGVAVRADGNVLIADTGNNRIRVVTTDPSRTITNYAGSGPAGFAGDNNRATTALLSGPTGVAELENNLGVVIADRGNHRIRRVSTGQIITTVAGNGAAENQGDVGQVFAPTSALNSPTSVAAFKGGYLIADTANNRIRWVDGTGFVSTFAGTGVAGFAGDGGKATSALLSGPTAVSVSGADVIVTDTGNNRVRKVDAAGNISTIAGNGSVGSAGDGVVRDATTVPLAAPRFATAVGAPFAGSILVSDTANARVRILGTPAPLPTVQVQSILVDITNVQGRRVLTFRNGKATLPYAQRNAKLRLRYKASQAGRANLLLLRGKRGVGAFGPPQGTVANQGTIEFRLKGAPVCYSLRLKFEVGNSPQISAAQKPQICVLPRRS